MSIVSDIWTSGTRTRVAFRNWIAVGILAGLASPSAIPPRAGLDALAHIRMRFKTRLGPVIETEAGNASPIVEVFRDGEYDIPVAWGDLDRIVDVGAHVGSFTAWAAWQAPQARLLAVEPEPRNFRDLLLNVERNQLGHRVECVESALAAVSGTIELHVPLHRDTTSTFAASGSRVEVEAISLSDLLDRMDGRIDLLKLDCEGAEWTVLSELPGELWSIISRIVMECHATSVNRVEDMIVLLQNSGFGVEVIERNPSGVGWYAEIATLFAERNPIPK